MREQNHEPFQMSVFLTVQHLQYPERYILDRVLRAVSCDRDRSPLKEDDVWLFADLKMQEKVKNRNETERTGHSLKMYLLILSDPISERDIILDWQASRDQKNHYV